jgi:two-component system, cell cycle response regulator DivK
MMPTILIVDDTEDNRELYSMILEEHLGYPIVLAVDGVEGVALARELNPTVILMDLAMPNMDGFEATRQIRALESDVSSVPIIAVTAFTDVLSAQRALAAGCNEVLTKPCPPSLLSARVEAAVESRRVLLERLIVS